MQWTGHKSRASQNRVPAQAHCGRGKGTRINFCFTRANGTRVTHLFSAGKRNALEKFVFHRGMGVFPIPVIRVIRRAAPMRRRATGGAHAAPHDAIKTSYNSGFIGSIIPQNM